MKSYKHGKGVGRRWPKIVLFLVVTAVLLTVAAGWGLRNLYQNNLKAVNAAASEDIVFVVETGTAVPEIAEQLESRELIRSARIFNQYVRSKGLGEAFIAGTYRLRQSMDTPTIVSHLTEGKVAVDLFTILPGKRLDQVKASFISQGFTESEVSTALNPALYKNRPALVDKPTKASLEGYLYPDSYQMIKGETKAETIVEQSLDEMAEALTPDIRNGFAKQGISVYQGIIIASIVEQEIPAAPIAPKEDRRKAAQVFLKRVEIGMEFRSDVTAFAGAAIKGEEPSVAFDSPYNTRLHPGFPPTPIGNVTSDGLDAVASPAKTDFLYFVAGDGEYENKTYFTKSIEEHEAAVDKYCNILCN